MSHKSKSIEQINFNHLVMDIAWFGLALAASTRFLSVYAIRLGATPIELGWLSAFPSLVLLASTGLSGWWRKRYTNCTQAVWWPSLGFRFSYLLPAFTPLFPHHLQPLWLILSISLPAVPQGIASVIFVVMMREAVDDQRIGVLISRRQLAMNIAIGIGALAFGLWLENAPFPINYQVMFLLAFAFTLFSQWHVAHVKTGNMAAPQPQAETWRPDHQSPWKSRRFQSVIFAAVMMHLAFFAIVPVVPLYLVSKLGAGEGFMALFGLAELAAGATAALFSDRLVRRIGSRSTIALMLMGTSIAALVIAWAPTLEITLIAAAISGASWTAAGIGLFRYFTENTPREDMTPFTTVYHQVIFLSMFIGPMLGSSLANSGIQLVLIITLGAGSRFLAGLLIQSGLSLYHRAHTLIRVKV